jgi:DNA-binding NarL/FixJ family response regulator
LSGIISPILDEEIPMKILLWADDLMTKTRLQSAWKAAGATMVPKNSDEKPDLVVVDLTAREAIEHLARLRQTHPGTDILAFGPHVDAEGFRAAKAAGASDLVSRGSVLDKVLGRLTKAAA